MDSEQVSAAPKPEFLAPPTWVVPLGPNTQITSGGTKSADLRVKAPWSVRAEAIAGIHEVLGSNLNPSPVQPHFGFHEPRS